MTYLRPTLPRDVGPTLAWVRDRHTSVDADDSTGRQARSPVMRLDGNLQTSWGLGVTNAWQQRRILGSGQVPAGILQKLIRVSLQL